MCGSSSISCGKNSTQLSGPIRGYSERPSAVAAIKQEREGERGSGREGEREWEWEQQRETNRERKRKRERDPITLSQSSLVTGWCSICGPYQKKEGERERERSHIIVVSVFLNCWLS